MARRTECKNRYFWLVFCFLLLGLIPEAHAEWTRTVLYDFGVGNPTPLGGLVADGAGNLYGVTSDLIVPNGEIFMLSSPVSGKGAWVKTTLYTFTGTDGVNMVNGGLAIDASGNLFGTSVGTDMGADQGAVFELEAPKTSASTWTFKIIHAFDDTNNAGGGSGPTSGLVFDKAGNLYGTTQYLGPEGLGTTSNGVAFKMTPPATGKSDWTEEVIYAFNSYDFTGLFPHDGLTIDGFGNLYGVASLGGSTAYGAGDVYELSPRGKNWVPKELFYFNYVDGQAPYFGLTLDAAGNLYGSTFAGGVNTNGNVFELSPTSNPKAFWTQTIISESFTATKGLHPIGRLTLDAYGNLYGAASNGGSETCPFGCGTLFELTPPSAGSKKWGGSIIFHFHANKGGNPLGSMLIDKVGNLYGLTQYQGNPSGFGTFYKLSPPALEKSRLR